MRRHWWAVRVVSGFTEVIRPGHFREPGTLPITHKTGPRRYSAGLLVEILYSRLSFRQADYLLIGVVMTAGFPLFGSTISRDAICLSVLTPMSFPNTGAVTVTATLTLSADAPLGTLPVYEHTPPQPYFMVDDEATRLPFNMVTVGGRILPPLVKSRGPYISEPEPTIDTAPADNPTLPFP